MFTYTAKFHGFGVFLDRADILARMAKMFSECDSRGDVRERVSHVKLEEQALPSRCPHQVDTATRQTTPNSSEMSSDCSISDKDDANRNGDMGSKGPRRMRAFLTPEQVSCFSLLFTVQYPFPYACKTCVCTDLEFVIFHFPHQCATPNKTFALPGDT